MDKYMHMSMLLLAMFGINIAMVRNQVDMHSNMEQGAMHSDFTNSANNIRINWKELGQKKIYEAHQRFRKSLSLEKPAKNIIFILGDGMGVSTLTAARIYMAQNRNLTGDRAALSWENMPHVALSKVYSANMQVPDSAATSTAMLCGEKTNTGVVGCHQEAVRDNCSSEAGTQIPSIAHYARQEGRWTGVISTARITHASPAPTYAHTVNRNWESDADMPEDARDVCFDIASQFIDNKGNDQIRVFLGGGRSKFFPNDTSDPEYPTINGSRTDGRNLVEEWLSNKRNRNIPRDEYSYVDKLSDFNSVDPEHAQYLMGLFEPSHMQYELDRENATKEPFGEPSLAAMVEKSIKILQKSAKGYFLFVEGGRVDHAHHENNAKRALGDTVALSDAVQRAIDLTSEDDTLIVVTADHSHVFTMAGYQPINTNIFEFDPAAQTADDGKPISTLGYTNGPGYYYHRTENGSISTSTLRLNQSKIRDEMDSLDFLQDAGAPLKSETHSGEDVAIFARGPMAHLFMGTQEQSYIGNLMMYAFCVGDNKDLCNDPPAAPDSMDCQKDGSLTFYNLNYYLILFSFVSFCVLYE